MEDFQKRAIQAKFQYLLLNLEARPLADYLHSKEIFSDSQLNRIHKEQISEEQSRLLIKLFRCSTKQCAYNCFIEGLEEFQSFIAEELRNEENTQHARDIFEKTFEQSNEGELQLEIVTTSLQQKNIELPHQSLVGLLQQYFKCDIEKLDDRNEYIVKRLAHRGERKDSTSCLDLPESVKDWTVKDVCIWLTLSGFSEEIISDFRDQDYTGDILNEITEEELKSDEFPHVTTGGQRKRILKNIRELPESYQTLVKEQNIASEASPDSNQSCSTTSWSSRSKVFARPFDSGHPEPTQKYKFGAQLQLSSVRQDNLLTPINKFLDLNLKDTENSFLMVRTAVEFCCACLNDRTNGRLYIGVTCSNDEGVARVKGTALDKTPEDYRRSIDKMLEKCFCADQHETVFGCVRPLKIVEVAQDFNDKSAPNHTDLYVLELDVVPSFELCQKEAFFVHLPEQKDRIHLSKELSLLRFKMPTGDINIIKGDELFKYMQNKGKLAELRQYRENIFLQTQYKDETRLELGNRFKQLLCIGTEKLSGDVYPILVCNQPCDSISDSEFNSAFSCLSDVRWTAVFDFDCNGRLYQLTENQNKEPLRIFSSAQEFDPSAEVNTNNPELLKAIHEEIRTSPCQPWIFVNGYSARQTEESKSMDRLEWKRNRRQGLRESIRLFDYLIPKGRCIVVFLVMSDNNTLYQEGIEEFLAVFPFQWMLVAERRHTANEMIDELCRRGSLDNELVKERSIFEMPWNHMSQNIKEVVGYKSIGALKLPSSTGTYITVEEQDRVAFFDLEIVSSNVFEDESDSMQKDERKKLELDEEYRFFKGGKVSWWNFYFKRHVLKRQSYDDLVKKIDYLLKRNVRQDSKVGSVYLYHEPGAGGTTLARHILWDKCKDYRCVDVKDITEDTTEQLIKLQMYSDPNPLPLLLLLDNLDDHINEFLSNLESKARQYIPEREQVARSFLFVALICVRRTELPRREPMVERILLRHYLEQNEISWFDGKFQELYQRGSDDSQFRINPKLLISFNIMKSNFDENFLLQMTKELVGGITDPKEKKLLKYVALLNAYDLGFTEVPSAAFDRMMGETFWVKGPRRGRFAQNQRWETNLSNEFRILMNESSSKGLKYISGLRITNILLSKVILSVLRKMEHREQTTSEIFLEFLNNKDIFAAKDAAAKNLQSIVKNVMTKRDKKSDGLPLTKFSPAIQEIMANYPEQANAVLIKAFELTEDPFIAQHIARLNTVLEKWDQATEFAEKAIHIKPDQSHLLDTYGRIFCSKLEKEYKKLLESETTILKAEKTLDIIKTAKKGADAFRKVQELNETQNTRQASNNAGYFGELQINIALLHCLFKSICFSSIDELKQFLLSEEYYPDELLKYRDTEEEVYINYLKKLAGNCEQALVKLNEVRMQMSDICLDEYQINETKYWHKKLDEIPVTLAMYFGEDTNETPSNLTEREQTSYRRRRINQLDGMTFRGIFSLRKDEDGSEKLKDIKMLCLANVQSHFATVTDYMKLITANLSLIQISFKYVTTENITFKNMVEWSRSLYKIRGTAGKRIMLEAYMFFVMFNWPRKATLEEYHKPRQEIQAALQEWTAKYLEKYPRQRDDRKFHRKHEKTLVFFKYGSDVNSLAFDNDLKVPINNRQSHGIAFWEQPHIKRTLETFEGTLSSEGYLVTVNIPGETTCVEIPTSMPIRNKMLWNKTVYFVIGFSWSGPKAFNVTSKRPSAADLSSACAAEPRSDRSRKGGKKKDKWKPNHRVLAELTPSLQKVQKIKSKIEKGEKITDEENLLLNGEQELWHIWRKLHLEQLEQHSF